MKKFKVFELSYEFFITDYITSCPNFRYFHIEKNLIHL
jgi:hypothetical protein